MGCLIAALALIGPRVALVFVWISTTFVDRAFDSTIVPLLGLVFLPWTTLVYALAYDGNNVNLLGWFFVFLAFMADLSSTAGSARTAVLEARSQTTVVCGLLGSSAGP